MSAWDDPRYSWGPADQQNVYDPARDGPITPYVAPAAPPPPPGGSPSVAPMAATPPGPDATSRGELTGDQQDAFARIRATLHQYRLDTPEVVDWARDQIIHGTPASSMELDLYDPTTVPGKLVDQLYPQIGQRRSKGFAPISIGDAVAYMDSAGQLMRAANIPAGFYDQPDDLARFQANDVSLTELKGRIDQAMVAAVQAPPETRQQLHTLYGIDTGNLAAVYLDPDKALPLLQQQFAAAQVAGVGQRVGYGQLSTVEAERLAGLGVTVDQAQQAFGTLAQDRELFHGLPGAGEATIGRDEQLAAAFGGDVAAQEAIKRRAAARKAVFGAGGGFATAQQGVTGLASAAR